jgi:cytochrome bd-type quinol oxidase subunit 2
VLGQRVLTRISVRAAVLIGFVVLTVASVGLLAIDERTPLAVTATLLAGRAVAIGLVITPLLVVLTQPLEPGELADANTLFNIWQRIAGSLGVGVIAAVFTASSHTNGPVDALHTTGIVITAISAVGALAAVLLPRVRNTNLAGW